MPSKSTKLTSSASSRRKVNSVPKATPLPASRSAQPYLVVDTTLPSHIITDRSLFTTYTAGRRVYRTTFGHNIIIEGTGDVDIRVFVAGQYICFCMRDCWHVPSSAHHFLSCAIVTSRGHQVLIAGRSPRMIYSHKCRLVEPKLPKYIPFTQVDGLIVISSQPSLRRPPLSPTLRLLLSQLFHYRQQHFIHLPVSRLSPSNKPLWQLQMCADMLMPWYWICVRMIHCMGVPLMCWWMLML